MIDALDYDTGLAWIKALHYVGEGKVGVDSIPIERFASFEMRNEVTPVFRLGSSTNDMIRAPAVIRAVMHIREYGDELVQFLTSDALARRTSFKVLAPQSSSVIATVFITRVEHHTSMYAQDGAQPLLVVEFEGKGSVV